MVITESFLAGILPKTSFASGVSLLPSISISSFWLPYTVSRPFSVSSHGFFGDEPLDLYALTICRFAFSLTWRLTDHLASSSPPLASRRHYASGVGIRLAADLTFGGYLTFYVLLATCRNLSTTKPMCAHRRSSTIHSLTQHTSSARR